MNRMVPTTAVVLCAGAIAGAVAAQEVCVLRVEGMR